MDVKLALEDGRIFFGKSVGARGESTGEICFNTSLTGYQEIFSDPSYAGQILCMTASHIGNTGVNLEDMESEKTHFSGLVVRNLSPESTHWRSRKNLPQFLRERHVVAATDVDTRALTRHLRTRGAMRAVLSTEDLDDQSLVEKAKAAPSLSKQDLVGQVSCKEKHAWEGVNDKFWLSKSPTPKKHKVVVLDFGVKHNILRSLCECGCDVTVVPHNTSAEDVLALKPDGVLLSNGPGDPEQATAGIKAAKHLLGKLPLFGICLGHQILALALSAKTYKLKFGHRGANHPVHDLRTGAIDISSQNHGFCVDADSLPSAAEVTHVNLNDQTLEGFALSDKPVMAIQYHPEASPGPHDALGLFAEFSKMMEAWKK